MFFVSIFFAPIFASIPPWATGGALVLVGSMMIRKYVLEFCYKPSFEFLTILDSVLEINWDYLGDAVPAFLTLLIIPLISGPSCVGSEQTIKRLGQISRRLNGGVSQCQSVDTTLLSALLSR